MAVAVCCSLPTSAAATDYCVGPKVDCPPANSFGTDVQAALTAAGVNAGPDRVLIGPGIYTSEDGVLYSDGTLANSVEVRGMGGSPKPTLTMTTTAAAAMPTVLNLDHANSSIHDLSIEIPNSGTNSRGVYLQGGTAEGLRVTGPANPATLQTGVQGGAVTLANADVSVSTTNAVGIDVTGSPPGTTIRDSTIAAARGLNLTNTGPALEVRRVRISAGLTGIHIFHGTVNVDNTLIDLRGGDAGPVQGIQAFAQAGLNALVNAGQLTIVNGNANSIGVAADADAATATVEVNLSNSIIDGVGHALSQEATNVAATTDIATTNSNYDDAGNVQTGPGATPLAETARTEFAPGFLAPVPGPTGISGDYRLRFDSPLIDLGDATPLGTGETDLGGQTRIVDGSLPLSGPRRDIGAYEYQRRPPVAAAVASPNAPAIGQQVSFASNGSGDPDGDPVSFTWAFDDGATAVGSTATHAFTSPGTHTATLTVTDATGQSSAATVPVTVATGDTFVRTAILKAPPERSSRKRVRFKFRAEEPDPLDGTRFVKEPGATFVCSLDKRRFTACTSPQRYRGLKVGRHRFRVIATDEAGNVAAQPATDRFRIVERKNDKR